MGDGFKGCYVCDGAGYIMVGGIFGEPECECCPLCIAVFQRNKAEDERNELRSDLDCAYGALADTRNKLFKAEADRAEIEAKYESLLDNLRAGHYAKQGCNLPHKERR